MSWRDVDLASPYLQTHPEKIKQEGTTHMKNHASSGSVSNKGTMGVTMTAVTSSASQESDGNRTKATGRDGGGAGALSPTGWLPLP